MLRVIVNELLVNLVRQNVDVFFQGNIDNRLKLLARVNRPGRIARSVQDQHLRARCHRVFKIFRAHFPRVGFARRHDHWFGSDQSDHVRITHPIWRWNDDFIAGLAGRENGVVTGVLGAVAHDDLAPAIRQLIVRRQFFRNRLAQFRNAGARCVFREACLQRFDRRLLDMFRRIEIRFARAEPAHIDPFRLHCLGFAVDGQRERWSELCRAFGNFHVDLSGRLQNLGGAHYWRR